MLTDTEKYGNKVKFLELLTKLAIDLTPLTKYFEAINYFEKPASTQYSFAYAGGLCEQALKMYEQLTKLCELYFPGRYSETDIIKVALFRELYRAEMYEPYFKNVKNESTGQWEQEGAYRTKSARPTFGEIGLGSFMIAKYFVSFTDEQIEAIINSTWSATYSTDIHEVYRQYPLTLLTKMAYELVNYIL